MRKILAALIIIGAPGVRAQTIFAPGIVSTPDSGDAFGAISPDGRAFYFTRYKDWASQRIVVSRLVGGKWTQAETLPFSGKYSDREPKLSVDGKRLYFSSNRPIAARDSAPRADLDLWFTDRAADGRWGAPVHIDAAGINTKADEFCPVVTANGTLYFISTRAQGNTSGLQPVKHNVWRAAPIDVAAAKWGTPEKLGDEIDQGFETNVYVTPDESMMFVSRDGAPGGLGGDDLYMSRRLNGAWQPMQHLPAPVNSKEYDYGPLVSPDGKWLYFTSHRTGNGDIYRISMGQFERDAVKRAALDYLEGFYEGDTVKLVRAFRADISKYGFWRDSTNTYEGERMTFAEAIDYAKKVKARNRPVPAQWPREVELFDVQDQTASAKVTAWWGTDYLLLGKYDGRWMISDVMWQGPADP